MSAGSSNRSDRFAHLPSGLKLCYRREGDDAGPLVVLVAGIGQHLTAWPQALVDGLVARGFSVIRFDNRDVGRSTRIARPAPGDLRLLTARPRPDAYTLVDMARDVTGLLDAVAVDRAHLVGQSMGGMIAQTVAARVPRRVASLTSMISTTGHRRVGQPDPKSKLLLTAPPARTIEQAVSSHLRMTRHLSGRDYAIDPHFERSYAVEAWARDGGANPDGLARQIQAIQASGDRTAELGRISAPTLVVHGDRDVMVHPSGGRATAAAIADAQYVTIPGMGHHLAPGLVDHLLDLIAANVKRAHV
ncbi:alpha/beta fold hydrolase [Brevibacterium atlanticum]|uniref:alpha/beta fold hydrolase n=1 Tax=Brevibacterium atlanticum TaxID=2697563 RepID=UPI001422A17F|nr:alpha/beta hydrolase [Brevibacterium atlanticum]